jgi:hypothetical protein
MPNSSSSRASDSVKPATQTWKRRTRSPRSTEAATHRSDREQVPVALASHDWQHGASDVHHAVYVGCELLVDLFRRHFLKRSDETVARVVDEDIDSTKVPQQWGQFLLVEFLHANTDVVREHEVDKACSLLSNAALIATLALAACSSRVQSCLL